MKKLVSMYQKYMFRPILPRLQLKQWKRFLLGVTAKDPVRSVWNGQSPIRVEPFLERLT